MWKECLTSSCLTFQQLRKEGRHLSPIWWHFCLTGCFLFKHLHTFKNAGNTYSPPNKWLKSLLQRDRWLNFNSWLNLNSGQCRAGPSDTWLFSSHPWLFDNSSSRAELISASFLSTSVPPLRAEGASQWLRQSEEPLPWVLFPSVHLHSCQWLSACLLEYFKNCFITGSADIISGHKREVIDTQNK